MMSDRVQDDRKRRNTRYGGPQARGKRWRGGRELEAGMTGILITCNMTERRCTAEAYSLLNEYADQLYGPEQLADSDGGSEDDVEAALQKEVRQFYWTTEKQQRRFTALESGANNVLFIRTHGIDPAQLVHFILQDLYTTQQLKSRVIMRMLPVCGSCKAFPEDMLKFLRLFLQPWFLSPRQASYQICFKSRNNNLSKRDDIIKSIAGLVNRLNPKNKVDLTDPELSIIIEVIKSVCCVSVIRDYKRFKKYNLQEVAKNPANQESSQVEVNKELANQETAEAGVSKELATQETAQAGVSKEPATQETAQAGVSEEPATQETAQAGVSEEPATQETAQAGVREEPANQETAQAGVSEEPANEETAQAEGSKEPANQESVQAEVGEEPANQESAQAEVGEEPANQESAQAEVGEEPANQESAQAEVAEGPANQESVQVELMKNDVDLHEGEPEVINDLSSQEQGIQEVAESKANQTEGQNVGEAENDIKMLEQV